MRRERFRCVRMIYVEAEGNTPILAQRIHEAAREGRQPTTERESPFGGSCEMLVDMGT